MIKLGNKTSLLEWALQAKHLWLFLDYDGTLAEFAPTPEHIEPNPELIVLIKQLSKKADFRLTVLSGRRLRHVRLLLPVSGIFLGGTYGIELLTPTGELIQRVNYEIIRPVLETIKPKWAELINGRNGFFLEDKGWTLALHARFAEDLEAEHVLLRALQTAGEKASTDHFRILGGHKFLEIAPHLASKKETVAYLLDQYPLPGARLMYIGDDDKDEEAFPLIHANEGIAIKVMQPSQAGQPTQADFFFEFPAETLRWLSQLI